MVFLKRSIGSLKCFTSNLLPGTLQKYKNSSTIIIINYQKNKTHQICVSCVSNIKYPKILYTVLYALSRRTKTKTSFQSHRWIFFAMESGDCH